MFSSSQAGLAGAGPGVKEIRAIRVLGKRFALRASSNPHDVLYHHHRVAKEIVIEFLVEIADARAALVVRAGVSLVDVAYLERFGVEQLAVNLKLAGNIQDLFFLIEHSHN
jgi:hypothetical protein